MDRQQVGCKQDGRRPSLQQVVTHSCGALRLSDVSVVMLKKAAIYNSSCDAETALLICWTVLRNIGSVISCPVLNLHYTEQKLRKQRQGWAYGMKAKRASPGLFVFYLFFLPSNCAKVTISSTACKPLYQKTKCQCYANAMQTCWGFSSSYKEVMWVTACRADCVTMHCASSQICQCCHLVKTSPCLWKIYTGHAISHVQQRDTKHAVWTGTWTWNSLGC